MKKIILICILISLTSCTSFYNRPVQDQVVGGNAVIDFLSGKERVGIIVKRPSYDSFISKPILNEMWFSHIPLLNSLIKIKRHEICRAPPADAMVSAISSFNTAIVASMFDTNKTVTATAAFTIAETFANKMQAFSIRTQGIQYMRDILFDNCIIWLNRGNLENDNHDNKKELMDKLMESNKTAVERGKKLISEELILRAITNNFGATNVGFSKKKFDEFAKIVKESGETMKKTMEELKNISNKMEEPIK